MNFAIMWFKYFIAALIFYSNSFLLAADHKVVLVTGASRGLGLLIAKKLSDEGYIVYASLRERSDRTNLNEAVKSRPSSLRPIYLDVTDGHSILVAVQRIIYEMGRIDILINNACEAIIGTCETMTLDEQVHLMNVNYFGPVRMLQAVLPQMRKQRQGHVINMSSVAGFDVFPLIESYCASKFALEGLSESLAVYMDQWDIKVTLIEPSSLNTGASSSSLMGSRWIDDTACFESFCFEGWQMMQNSYQSWQPSEEVAELIVKILREEHPRLRYQTSTVSANMAAMRWLDPSGDSQLLSKKSRQRLLLKLLE